METFRKIRELRKNKKISQSELAKALQVTQPTVTSWETGKAEPSSSALYKMADYFGVTTDYLLGRSAPNGEHALTVKEALDSVMSSDGKGIREADKPILEAIISKYLAEAR